MSFSNYAYYAPRDVTHYQATKPVSAANATAALNNAAHLADESGQVLVNWGLKSSGYIGFASNTGTTWRRVERYGPFPTTVRPDGKPFELRVHVRKSIGNVSAGTGTIRIVCGPLISQDNDARTDSPPPGIAMTNVLDFTATSSTANTGSGMIVIPAEKMSTMLQPIASLDDSSNAQTVTVPQIYVDVWVKSSSASNNDPKLHSLYVAEYVGA